MPNDTSPLDPQGRSLHAILRAHLPAFLRAHALPGFVRDELVRNCILVTVDPGRPIHPTTGFAIQLMEFEWFRSPNGAGFPDSAPLVTTGYTARANPTVSVLLTNLSPVTYEFEIVSSMPVVVGAQNTRQIILLHHTPGTTTIQAANLLAVETGLIQSIAEGSLHGSLEVFDFTGARTP